MSTYGLLSDVRGRLPHRTIDASSQPAQADVQAWLDEAEDMINGTLQAGGLPAPYTAQQATRILGIVATDYAEGRYRNAYAAAAGEGTDPRGEELLRLFRETVADMRRNPGEWGAVLAGGAGPDSARQVRGHVLDNRDGLTVAGGDFAPTFSKGGENF